MDPNDRTTHTPLKDRIFRRTQPWTQPAPDLAEEVRRGNRALLIDALQRAGIYAGHDERAVYLTWTAPHDTARTFRQPLPPVEEVGR